MTAMYSPTTRSEFERRYGAQILARGYYDKPSCLSRCFTKMGLTRSQVLVLDYLLSRLNAKSKDMIVRGVVAKQIAEGLGLESATVLILLDQLEKSGWLVKKRKIGWPSEYHLDVMLGMLDRHQRIYHSPTGDDDPL